MVFTTLSSTGRKVFSRLQAGHFETVLIDEAAQASEVTTLQALTFGCRRCGPYPAHRRQSDGRQKSAGFWV